MKYWSISILIFVTHSWCIGQSSSSIRGIDFISDFDVAKKLAKSEEKFIFVDVYADWCQPCKVMDRQVFTDAEVGKFFKKRFISVKLDADTYGNRFATRNKIDVLPSLLFFNSEGEEMSRVEGFVDAEALIKAGERSFRNPNLQEKEFRNDYSKFKNNPNYLRHYIKFSEENGDYEMVDKLSDQFARVHSRTDSIVWMEFVMRYAYKEKSRTFNLLKDNKEAFIKTFGEEEVNMVFLDIFSNAEINKRGLSDVNKLIKEITKKSQKYDLQDFNPQMYKLLSYRVFDPSNPVELSEEKTAFGLKVLRAYGDDLTHPIITRISGDIVINKDDKASNQLVKEKMMGLLNDAPSAEGFDILSIALYKLGEKEESYKTVAKAQAIATKQNIQFKSSLTLMKKAGLIE